MSAGYARRLAGSSGVDCDRCHRLLSQGEKDPPILKQLLQWHPVVPRARPGPRAGYCTVKVMALATVLKLQKTPVIPAPVMLLVTVNPVVGEVVNPLKAHRLAV